MREPTPGFDIGTFVCRCSQHISMAWHAWRAVAYEGAPSEVRQVLGQVAAVDEPLGLLVLTLCWCAMRPVTEAGCPPGACQAQLLRALANVHLLFAQLWLAAQEVPDEHIRVTLLARKTMAQQPFAFEVVQVELAPV